MQMETQSSQADQTDGDGWSEGQKALQALQLNETAIMDFGQQNTLLQRITKEQLLAGQNKAILCVSRSDLRPFSCKIKELYDRIHFHEREVFHLKELSLHKGYELEKSQKEIQGLKKQLASTTARATKAEAEAKAGRRDALLADLHEPGFALQDSPAGHLSLEESERLQMRVADQESLVLSSFEPQDLDETIGTIMTIPSTIEQREDLAAAEQQRKQSARSNWTMQKLLDTVHNELKEESARSQAARHEVRRARSEAAVLRALLQKGSKEASEISQTSPSEDFVRMDVVKEHRTANMAGMQKMQERLNEEMEDCDALAVALEEVMEKLSQYQRRLEERELEIGQLRVEMEKSKVELAQHHQSQPILLQEKAALERQLHEVTQSEAQKQAQLEEAQARAQHTAAENELKLEEAKARGQQLEEAMRLTEEKYKELQANLQQTQPILLQEKEMLEQQVREAQELVQQTTAVNAEKQLELEEAKARGQQLEEAMRLTEEKYKELQANLQQTQPILLQEKEMLQQQVREAEKEKQQMLEDLKQQMQLEAQQYSASLQELARAEIARRDEQVLQKGKENADLEQQLQQARDSVSQFRQAEAAMQVQLQELEAEKRRSEEQVNELKVQLQQSQPIFQEREDLQQQLQEVRASVTQFGQAEAAMQMQLQELEAEKRRSEEQVNELKVQLQQSQPIFQEREDLQQQLQEARASVSQFRQAEAAMQMQLQEASSYAQQMEAEKRRSEEQVNELKVQLQQSQPVLEVSHDSPTGPASFDISTPRSHKSPWPDSPEERRPDDAIVAENKQLHQRIAVVEEEKAIMMQNLRDHVMQLARENWDLKNRGGFVEDSSRRSQSIKEAPPQESMANGGADEGGSGGWLLSTILSPFLTDGDKREIHAESYVEEHLDSLDIQPAASAA